MKFIAFTGPIGSGKSEASKILIAKGYERFSLTDSVVSALQVNYPGKPITREAKQDMGDEGRLQNGNDYWAKITSDRVSDFIKEGTPCILIDSIYNPAEIDYLRQRFPDIVVVGFEADREIREQRALNRVKEGDPTNKSDLEKALVRDMGDGQPDNGQQVKKCLEKADITVSNDTEDIEDFEAKFEIALIALGIEGTKGSCERE